MHHLLTSLSGSINTDTQAFCQYKKEDINDVDITATQIAAIEHLWRIQRLKWPDYKVNNPREWFIKLAKYPTEVIYRVGLAVEKGKKLNNVQADLGNVDALCSSLMQYYQPAYTPHEDQQCASPGCANMGTCSDSPFNQRWLCSKCFWSQ